MKGLFIAIFLGLFAVSYNQVITEEEFRNKVKAAQENCAGAHESVVYRTNASFTSEIWDQTIRFNNARIDKFFSHPSAQKIVAEVDLNMVPKKTWKYVIEQEAAADLLTNNGVKVSKSYSALLINAKQNILQAESTLDGQKILLELYCTNPAFLEIIRIGKEQSIECKITSFWAKAGGDPIIAGVVTGVNAEKQSVSCSSGHEYDKALGYQFCPKCGQALE